MKTTINEQIATIQSCIFWHLQRRHDIMTGETNKEMTDAEREDYARYADAQIAALEDARKALRLAFQLRRVLGEFINTDWVELPEDDDPEEAPNA